MLIKDLFTILQLATNRKNLKMLYNIHKEFSKDKSYSPLNLLKSMWLVSKDEKVVKHKGVYMVSSFLPPMPSRAYMQVFNATPNRESKFYEHTHAMRTAPISMFLAITERCDYNCWHCSKANRKYTKDMELSKLKKLIRDLQDMGTAMIGITGGEPLLRDDLAEIVKSIDERSTSILFTSGKGMTLSKAKELEKAGLFSVGISLDHYNKTKFDKARGYKGAYEIALDAFKNSKKAGLYTMLQCVVTKEMLKNDDTWKMIELAKKIGVDEIRFLEAMPTGRLINIESKHIFTEAERKQLIRIHKKANWAGKYPKVSVFAHTESFEQFGCGAGTQHSYIDAKGDLYPCDFVPMTFGNINNIPIKKLWKDMNLDVGNPKKHCLIMQTYKKIQKNYKNALPLDRHSSRKICSECKSIKDLPGFYTTLRGKK